METALRRRLDAITVICAAILAFQLSAGLFRRGVFVLVGWLLLTVGITKAAGWYVQFSVVWETTEPAGPES